MAVNGKVGVESVPGHDSVCTFEEDPMRGRAGSHLGYNQFDLLHWHRIRKRDVQPLGGKVVCRPPSIKVAVNCTEWSSCPIPVRDLDRSVDSNVKERSEFVFRRNSLRQIVALVGYT